MNLNDDSTSKEVEKDLIEEQTKTVIKDAAPEEVAAQLFYLYSPRFVQGISMLSKKALQRLITKLITYPLNDKELKHQSELEKNLFLIGDRLLESKYVMIIHTVTSSQEVQEAIQEKLEENENGKNEAEGSGISSQS